MSDLLVQRGSVSLQTEFKNDAISDGNDKMPLHFPTMFEILQVPGWLVAVYEHVFDQCTQVYEC